MIIIGIDQSYTSTGIVALTSEELILFDTFTTTRETDDVFERAWAITNFVTTTVSRVVPDIIVVEGLSFGNMGNVTRNLAGLQFLIICNLRFKYNYKVIIVAPKALKKIATGSGRSSKQNMIDSLPIDVLNAFKTKGYKKSTGLKDLTDAYWLCKCIEDQNI